VKAFVLPLAPIQSPSTVSVFALNPRKLLPKHVEKSCQRRGRFTFRADGDKVLDPIAVLGGYWLVLVQTVERLGTLR
jgi:hypothetical protein